MFSKIANVIAPSIATIMTAIMDEITRPAIARPRGFLNIPIRERIKPTNQTIIFNPGIQHKNMHTSEITNPAIPIPLDD